VIDDSGVEAPRVIVAAATVKLVIAGAGTTVSVVCALLCCRAKKILSGKVRCHYSDQALPSNFQHPVIAA